MSEYPARKGSQVPDIGQAALRQKRILESHSGLQERRRSRPKGCGGLLSAGAGLCRNQRFAICVHLLQESHNAESEARRRAIERSLASAAEPSKRTLCRCRKT